MTADGRRKLNRQDERRRDVLDLAARFFVAGPFARRSASSSSARSCVIDSVSSPCRRLAFVSPSVT
jgi:hypothetical protein